MNAPILIKIIGIVTVLPMRSDMLEGFLPKTIKSEDCKKPRPGERSAVRLIKVKAGP
jgi:hypothetical protein